LRQRRGTEGLLMRVVALLLGGPAVCSGAPASAQVLGPGAYRLGPRDVLEVSVLDFPGLTQTAAVWPGGRAESPCPWWASWSQGALLARRRFWRERDALGRTGFPDRAGCAGTKKEPAARR
jgi:protein involved in polysaccharide export with SLBB domain